MRAASFDETQIRETAHLLWLEEGQPQGRDKEHWLQANDILKKASAKPKAVRKAAAKKSAASAMPKKAAKPKAAVKTKAASKKK